MSPQSTAGPGGAGRRFEEAIELIEMELRHAIAYVNDAVIPQVRRESITAMRAAADTLRDLADRFERGGNRSQTGTQPGQGNAAGQSNATREPGR
jgi:hypothetical protein